MPTVNYICEDAPNLSFRLQDEPEVSVTFINKVLKLDPETEDGAMKIRLLDRLMGIKTHLAIMIKKKDLAYANAVVAKHQAFIERTLGVAKGAFTAGHISAMRTMMDTGNLRDRMEAEGLDPQKIEETLGQLEADAQLIIPVKDASVVHDQSGFVADPKLTHEMHVDATAQTKTLVDEGKEAAKPVVAVQPISQAQQPIRRGLMVRKTPTDVK